MKNYRKFFITTLIVLVLSMIAIPAGLIKWLDFMIGRHHYSKTADYINYLIEQKNAKAREFDDKYGYKIVFFSGSNTLYGINSKYIHEKTNLPVLNYGIHMGLEQYIFHEAEKILKTGDIVIMPLEYTMYKPESSSIPAQLAEYMVTYGRDYYDKLTPLQKIGLSFYLVKLIITYHKIDADPLDEETLAQTNDFGDFVANKGVPEDKQNKRKPTSVTQELPDNPQNTPVYKFIKYCKDNGITLIATTPFIYHNPEFTKKETENFSKIKQFYNSNGIDFMGDIDTGAVFDEKYVYDFGYHANDEGQKLRSDYFIDILANIVSI